MIAILFFASLTLWPEAPLWFFFGDEPPPLDDDLRLETVEVPEERNGFHLLSQAAMKVAIPNDENGRSIMVMVHEGKEWDETLVRQALEMNAEVFRLVEESLSRPAHRIPGPFSVGMPIPYLLGLRDICDLHEVRSRALAREGRDEEAFEAAWKLMRFGQAVQDSQGTLIHYLVGTAVKCVACRQMRWLLSMSRLTSGDLVAHGRRLQGVESSTGALANAFRREYEMLRNALEDIASLEKIGEIEDRGFTKRIMIRIRFFYQPNGTRRLAAELYRSLIANLGKRFSEREPLPFEMPERLTENVYGKVVTSFLLETLEKAATRTMNEEVEISATRLLIAMKRYQLETGKLPEALADLVPKYIDRIPEDPFDGKPLRYSPGKKLIYSIGSDLEDSGGTEDEEKQGDAEEPTFPVKLGPAARRARRRRPARPGPFAPRRRRPGASRASGPPS